MSTTPNGAFVLENKDIEPSQKRPRINEELPPAKKTKTKHFNDQGTKRKEKNFRTEIATSKWKLGKDQRSHRTNNSCKSCRNPCSRSQTSRRASCHASKPCKKKTRKLNRKLLTKKRQQINLTQSLVQKDNGRNQLFWKKLKNLFPCHLPWNHVRL